MTLMMRPSSPGPTGTEIGAPVSVTSCPRTRPSEESMATVRTVDSPRCCATSSTRRLPPCVVSSAFRIAVRSPSNCTSTTAPMTWVMRPVWIAMMSSSRISSAFIPFDAFSSANRSPPRIKSGAGFRRENALERLGAGDDLDQFLGDHRLAGAVVGERLLADHLAGVSGGVIHRRHLRAVERRCVLDERAEYLHREIARQKFLQDILFVRLELIDRAAQSIGS